MTEQSTVYNSVTLRGQTLDLLKPRILKVEECIGNLNICIYRRDLEAANTLYINVGKLSVVKSN
jgi:hypothetical protein